MHWHWNFEGKINKWDRSKLAEWWTGLISILLCLWDSGSWRRGRGWEKGRSEERSGHRRRLSIKFATWTGTGNSNWVGWKVSLSFHKMVWKTLRKLNTVKRSVIIQGKLKMGKYEALSSPLHDLLARNSSLTTSDQFLLIRETKMTRWPN